MFQTQAARLYLLETALPNPEPRLVLGAVDGRSDVSESPPGLGRRVRAAVTERVRERRPRVTELSTLRHLDLLTAGRLACTDRTTTAPEVTRSS